MRILVVTLALFCAAISGWTSALGQTRDLGVVHHAAPGPVHSDHGVSNADCPPATDPGCGAKSGHPLLCAACYAIPVDGGMIGSALPVYRAARPGDARPLVAISTKPRFPPPKTVSFL